MIPKILGRGCSGAGFLFGFACIFPLHPPLTPSRAGVQARLYLSPSSVEKEVKRHDQAMLVSTA